MKILFINQYYWPDYAATSQMLADLAEHLAAAGHEVTVLCSRGKYDDGSGMVRPLPRRETHHGVHIRRLAATGFGKRGTLGRVFDYASFHLLIGLNTLLTAGRHDLIVTLTTPPLVGVYATLVKALRRRRHVCWVMDLHPDCEFELGLFKRTSLLPRLLDALNGLHFRKADACVVLGRSMASRLEAKGVAPERLHEIPVWGHDLRPAPGIDGPLRRQLGLEGRCVVMYSGNAGLAHTFDAICEAARQLAGDERFVFLFVGGGRRLEEVRAFQQQHALANVRIMPYFPREQLEQSLALGDVHLVSLRPGMAGVAVPSKLYGIMAAGRPAVFVGPEDSETADAIRRAQCGKVIAPDDAAGLVAALRELADDPAGRERLGQRGRTAFEQWYSPSVCCEQWRALLDRVVP